MVSDTAASAPLDDDAGQLESRRRAFPAATAASVASWTIVIGVGRLATLPVDDRRTPASSRPSTRPAGESCGEIFGALAVDRNAVRAAIVDEDLAGCDEHEAARRAQRQRSAGDCLRHFSNRACCTTCSTELTASTEKMTVMSTAGSTAGW